jgi:iron complex outermembrane receptor protein
VDTEYLDYVISTGDFSGNQMQRTPETQFNTGFEFTTGAGSWEDALLFRLNYTWQDEMPWAHTNVAWEPSFGLFDGRISLAPQGQPWSVSVWGKNLTDEDVRANVIEFLGGIASIYAPPRTYGVDVTWEF